MFHYVALNAARRVVAPSQTVRSVLTRSLSSAPALRFPAKAGTSADASKTEAATKSKPKSTSTKTKPKAKESEKEKKKTTFTREELKVPIRPHITAYIAFCQAQFKNKRVLSLSEGAASMKEFAQKWGTLTVTEKEVYAEDAAKQNAALAEVYNKWIGEVSDDVLHEINARRAKAGKNTRITRPRSNEGPKAPPTAFFRFLAEFRVRNPSILGRQTASAAGAEWRTLSEDAKKGYFEDAAAERTTYDLRKKSEASA